MSLEEILAHARRHNPTLKEAEAVRAMFSHHLSHGGASSDVFDPFSDLPYRPALEALVGSAGTGRTRAVEEVYIAATAAKVRALEMQGESAAMEERRQRAVELIRAGFRPTRDFRDLNVEQADLACALEDARALASDTGKTLPLIVGDAAFAITLPANLQSLLPSSDALGRFTTDRLLRENAGFAVATAQVEPPPAWIGPPKPSPGTTFWRPWRISSGHGCVAR